MDNNYLKMTTKDRQYHAVSVVLKKHQKIEDYFFNKQKKRLNQSSQKILKNASVFSAGEFVLVKVALDILDGSGNAKIWEIIEVLDARNFANVIEGLVFLSKIKLQKEELINRLVNETKASSPEKELAEG